MPNQERSITPFLKPPKAALRLTFEYKGGEVRLISSKSLAMTVPPSHSFEEPRKAVHTQQQGAKESKTEGRSGFWLEVKDAAGRTLYRRGTQNPMRLEVELQSGDPERPFTRRAVQNPHGVFVFLIPDLPEASEVMLFSSPLEPGASALAARQIARFDLKKGQRGKEVGR